MMMFSREVGNGGADALPEQPHRLLLLCANDLGFRATVREIEVAANGEASPWHGDVMAVRIGSLSALVRSASLC